MKKYPVVPYTKTEVYNIASISINVVQMNLNNSANIAVTLFTDSGKVATNTILTMSGSDYLKWGNDDNYIKEYVSAQLGITILDAPPMLTSSLPANIPKHLVPHHLIEKYNLLNSKK